MRFFTGWRAARDRAAILDSLSRIEQRQIDMARTQQELSDDMDKIAAGVTTAVAEVADLKTQIANLGSQTSPVSQDQLDALTAKADGIVSALSALTAPATDAPPATT